MKPDNPHRYAVRDSVEIRANPSSPCARHNGRRGKVVTQNLTEGTWSHPVEPYYWVEIERRDEIGCVVLLMIDEAFLRPWQFNRECDQVVRWEDCAWRPK